MRPTVLAPSTLATALHGERPAMTAEEMQAEVDAVKEQLERYGFRLDMLQALNVVKITLTHSHLVDLAPPILYLPIPVLLKTAGQILSVLDVG
jgi:hypothetical protein